MEHERKTRAASFSIAANVSLMLIKAVVGLLSGSIAILAEVLHSFFDLLASVFAYVGIRHAAKPADEKHHYGHEKYENLSSILQTILIAVTAVVIIYESVQRIAHPSHDVQNVPVALGVMGLTLVVDIIVARYLHKISSETKSAALEADAYHFSTDLWSAIAVLVGLAFVMTGHPVFDAVAAIVVAVLMLFVSYTLGKKSIVVMLDESPPADVVAEMQRAIGETPGVQSFHHFRMRQSGSKLLGDVHIRVDGELSVRQGHDLAHKVKNKLVALNAQIKDVTVHVEPTEPRRRTRA